MNDDRVDDDPKKSEWIRIKDRTPLDDQTVFCHCPGKTDPIPLIAYYDKESKGFYILFSWQEILIYPSHWMPIPKPPKDECES